MEVGENRAPTASVETNGVKENVAFDYVVGVVPVEVQKSIVGVADSTASLWTALIR